MKITSWEHVVYINWFFVLIFITIYVHNRFWARSFHHENFMYWTGKSVNNLLSYFGLVDARMRTSNKDLTERNQKYQSVFAIKESMQQLDFTSKLRKTWLLCNINFVILNYFHLTFFFFLEKKNSANYLLETKWLIKRSW